MRHPGVRRHRPIPSASELATQSAKAETGSLKTDAQVQQALQILTPREAEVLRARFGLGAPHERIVPLERRLGVGQLWLRHLQLRALRKLRASALSG